MSYDRGQLARIIFPLTIIYAMILVITIRIAVNEPTGWLAWSLHQIWWPWIVAALLVKPLYRSFSYAFDLWIVWCALWFLAGPDPEKIPVYFSLITITWMLAAYPIPSRAIQALVPILSLGLLGYWLPALDWNLVTPGSWFILIATIFGLIVYSYDNLRTTVKLSGTVDAIVCSDSGNTAHYFEQFRQAASDRAASLDMNLQWNIYRFHYYQTFTADLQGNALVLAFPVSGWKPPWTLCAYLIWLLPWGHGKPAWILYTSSCGPENAGFVAWFLLTLKGYRVSSRAWAAYPLNVVTFRIGTAKFWQWLDKMQPSQSNLVEIQEFARAWVVGEKQGLPILVLPLPLIIFGILLDNKYVNIPLYRNYAWRRRCVRCGKCIAICPIQRLHPNEHGFPVAHGSCSLCMSCINECPTNAMQMLLWSEYGQPYPPRWPEYVVRHPQESVLKKIS